MIVFEFQFTTKANLEFYAVLLENKTESTFYQKVTTSFVKSSA